MQFYPDRIFDLYYIKFSLCYSYYRLLFLRECRNLFRSIVNFISHKRVICRSLLEISRPSSSDVQQVNEKATSELNCSSADPQAVLLDSTG